MDTRVDALRRWQGRDADREGSAADQLRALYESALASSMLRDWSRADARFAGALAIARASPNSSARAERAVALMQAQSLLDRGAPAQAAEAMKAYAGDGSRPSLLLDAQVALIATPAVTPESDRLKATRRRCRPGSRSIPTTRSPGARSARPGAGSACRCARSAPMPSRAMRSATCSARSTGCAPASASPAAAARSISSTPRCSTRACARSRRSARQILATSTPAR